MRLVRAAACSTAVLSSAGSLFPGGLPAIQAQTPAYDILITRGIDSTREFIARQERALREGRTGDPPD